MLLTYRWPGNIRELDNLLQRALILTNGPVIEPAHIRFESLGESIELRAPSVIAASGKALRGSLRAAEQQILLAALRVASSRREVAEKLGISPRTLRYKIAQLRTSGVQVPAA